MFASSGGLVQAAMPKVQGVVEVVRRRTTLRRPAGLARSESLADEKRRLMEEDWEIVHKEDVVDGRLMRSKSEMRPSRHYWRK